MYYIKGIYKTAKTGIPSKSGYVPQYIYIENEEGSKIECVQVPKNFVNSYKKGDKIEHKVYLNAYDERTKKYTSSGIKVSLKV